MSTDLGATAGHQSGQPGANGGKGVRHGARSESVVAAKARNHRRRFLRHLGVRVDALDAIANAHLWHWSRGQAVLDLREAAGVETNAKDYWVAYNATRRALDALERRLKQLGLDKPAKGNGRALDEHLAERYGR